MGKVSALGGRIVFRFVGKIKAPLCLATFHGRESFRLIILPRLRDDSYIIYQAHWVGEPS